MNKNWYPEFGAASWTETRKQTASRTSLNLQILQGSLAWGDDEPLLASFNRVLRLEDGSFGPSLANYYGILTGIDATNQVDPIAEFKNLTESLIDVDTVPTDNGGVFIRDRFEQVLGVQPLARVTLAQVVHVVCGPSGGTLYDHLHLD